MPPTNAPGLDVSGIVAAFDERVATMPAPDRALALRTLDRVRPPNWALEWHLPWWLGQAFGVPSPIAARAVLSNVLGLVAVRLTDDAADGELEGAAPGAAGRVSAALLAAAIELYRPALPPDSPFWPDLDRFLGAWRSATPPGHGPRPLAGRGAPLKAGARAMSLLGDRPAAWPELERCLDLALAALALYDDACDWRADLEAGRWNAFVAAAGCASQRPAERERNRARVLLALLNDGAAGRVFGAVAADARHAAELAEGVGCPPLADHLRGVAARSLAEGAAIGAHYAAAADRMTRLLFEPLATGGMHP